MDNKEEKGENNSSNIFFLFQNLPDSSQTRRENCKKAERA